MLKETNDKLEAEMKQLKEKLASELKEFENLRAKCENLEGQLKEERLLRNSSEEEKFKVMRVNYEEQLRNLQSSFEEKLERLEEDNANLKNKIIDLDRLVEEYENKYNTLKTKEQALEQQNKLLENELDRFGERSSNTEMHSQKIEALQQANRILEEEMENLKEQHRIEKARLLSDEHNRMSEHHRMSEHRPIDTEISGQKFEAMQQANRVLEEELDSLKEQHRNERSRLNERVNLLTDRHDERIKQLEETNRILEQELHRLRYEDQYSNKYDKYERYDTYEDSSTLNLIKSQCDSLKKRIVELEVYENTYRNLERDIERLKQDLRDKDMYYAEEMKKFDQENMSFNELNAGYAHLNETMLTMSRKYEQDMHNFDSKLKNLQNLLDKKGKKKLSIFNDCRIIKDSNLY